MNEQSYRAYYDAQWRVTRAGKYGSGTVPRKQTLTALRTSSRQAQTVLRTVPLHLNRTPSRPVKFPSLQNLSGNIILFYEHHTQREF